MKYAIFITLTFFFLKSGFAQTPKGWLYNDPRNGGFEVAPYEEQETAPGMVLIEGDTLPRTSIVINAFYISMMEETNGQYLAYLAWMKKVWSPAAYNKALPDTTVWMRELLPDSVKQYLVNNYLRGIAFRDYPVVGISAEQIKQYARWKTDRINEWILIREGLLEYVNNADSTDYFSTESYLAGKWNGQLKQKLPSFDEQAPERDVRMEDGIFLPALRMVTPAEWKLASLAIGDSAHRYVKSNGELKRKYDKEHHFDYLYVKPLKTKEKKETVFSCSKTGLHRVYDVPHNSYGLYGMAGNVSEWTFDSTGYYVIGGSWKTASPDFVAVYYPKYRTYQYPRSDVRIVSGQIQEASAVTGFRLAMDRVGTADASLKRKKVK